jgi:HEAT repeat protein
VSLLREKNRGLRLPGLTAAKELGPLTREFDESVIRIVTSFLNDPDGQVRNSALDVLGEIGPKAKLALPNLMQLVADSTNETRVHVLPVLSKVGREDALPTLMTALSDHDGEVRNASAFAMVELGAAAKPATPALIKCLKDSNLNVRANAAWALGSIGPDAAEAISSLQDASRQDKVPDVRDRAMWALSRISAARP